MSGTSVLARCPCARCHGDRDTQVTVTSSGWFRYWCLVCGAQEIALRVGLTERTWRAVIDGAVEPYVEASA